MKKVIYPLILSLVLPILIYLAFSFANVDFNIKTWHELARSFCAFLIIVGIFGGIGLGLVINDEIKKQNK